LNNICRSSYHKLCNIGYIKRYLTSDASKSLVNRLITSRLDYCNALLNGLRQTSINKLQRIQNTAARIVTRTSRRSHITPILKDLHWLPVKYPVQFKILMHTYKPYMNRLQDTYLICWQFINQEEHNIRWVQWH